MVRTKIQVINNKEYRTSIPKALAEAKEIKIGDLLQWTVMDGKYVAEVIRK